MKFLAILRDSLREALDTSVFYVMVGLSALTILVVASISFRPVPIEEDLGRLVNQVNWVMQTRMRNAPKDLERPSWEIKDFQQTNETSPLWERDYQFVLVVKLPGGKLAEAFMDRRGREANQKQVAQQLQQMFQAQMLRHLENVKAEPVGDSKPGEWEFKVTTSGSKVKRAADWPNEPTLFFVLPMSFWHPSVTDFVALIQGFVVNTFGAAVALLVSVVITAFFIPNMLRKGTIDLLLAKPMSRVALLSYKYVGGMTFMFLNTVFLVLGIWLVLGLRSGLWGTGFLVTIPILTFEFAFYYAVSTLFAVLTCSPIVAILMTCLTWLLLFLAGWGYFFVNTIRVVSNPEFQAEMREVSGQPAGEEPAEETPPQFLPDWVYTTADVVHFVLPRMKDLDLLADQVADQNQARTTSEKRVADKLLEAYSWPQAIGITLGWIVVILGLACWRFATRDY